MDPWKFLGIEKINDKRQIKKAYVKLLNKYHPEEDAEGFMKLRSAYENALKQAEMMKFQTLHSSMEIEEQLLEREETDKLIIETEKQKDLKKAQDHVLGKLQLIYDDIFKRRDKKCWKDFFLELSIDEYDILRQGAVDFLNDNFHLSYEVWNLLNDELMLCDNLGFKWANFVKYDFGLNFDYLDNKLDCDYVKYIDLRFKAFEAFYNQEYEMAVKYAKEGYDVYDKDAVLHRKTGISYYMLKDYIKANKFFSKRLLIEPKDIDSLIYRGYTYLKNGDFERAVKDFKFVLEIDSDNMEARKAFIFCFEKQKKYKLARKEIMNIQNDDFMDIELDILNFRHQKLNLIKKIKKLNFIFDKDKPFGMLINLLLYMFLSLLILLIPLIMEILFNYSFLIIPCLLIYFIYKIIKKNME